MLPFYFRRVFFEFPSARGAKGSLSGFPDDDSITSLNRASPLVAGGVIVGEEETSLLDDDDEDDEGGDGVFFLELFLDFEGAAASFA